jgi:sugar lactone lactonase YvrE
LDDDEQRSTGAFYRHDGAGLHRFADGMGTTNGPAVSPGGDLLYTVDSSARTVSRALMKGGAPGGAEAFLHFGPDDATPDGIAVDEEGCLWVAHHGGGRVTRFTPEGVAERVVTLPVARPTKCAFAGPDLTTLYVTTAGGGRPGLDDGHLFRVETGIRGLPAAIARI